MNVRERTALYRSVDVDHLIRMRIARLRIPGYRYDDLVQEGRLVAWNALSAFDASRGTLRTYLTRVIRNELLQLLTEAKTQKRKTLNALVDPDILERLPSMEPTAEEAAIIGERFIAIRRAIEQAKDRLGKVERQVMGCYMEPSSALIAIVKNKGRHRLSKQAIATYLGISVDRVGTVVRRIRRELTPVVVDSR